TLNHILLTLEAAHRRGLTVLGVVLSGFPDDPGLDVLTNPAALARLTPVPLLGVIPYDPDIDTEGGRPGDLARSGPAGLDPLLGGTFSRERRRRDPERPLPAAHSQGAPMDPTHAAHVLTTPDEYAELPPDLPWERPIEMPNA